MPTIHNIDGIQFIMWEIEKEHNPPHIHAYYGDYKASFAIKDHKILNGLFPRKQASKVISFIKEYEKELLEMWDAQIIHSIRR